jgi:hypothetical protein
MNIRAASCWQLTVVCWLMLLAGCSRVTYTWKLELVDHTWDSVTASEYRREWVSGEPFWTFYSTDNQGEIIQEASYPCTKVLRITQ